VRRVGSLTLNRNPDNYFADTECLLTLRPDECAEVFLVSGSFEERKEYAGDILANQDCRIVLCSPQYTTEVQRTFTYLIESNCFIFLQWLNPGYNGGPAAERDPAMA
jgi:Catalase